jgi:hypothetical protein
MPLHKFSLIMMCASVESCEIQAMCAIRTRMLRDDPTGNYVSMAPPLVVTPALAWMCRTTLLAAAGNQNASVYQDSNMVIVLTVQICELILLKAKSVNSSC